jgi:DNA-binding transcriptional LysR family regulator
MTKRATGHHSRSTSAVSYAITNLEQQLGVLLFDRDQARRPGLTEAGTAVLSEARSVSVGVDNLRAKAKGLLDGLEAQITLAVDVMLPTARWSMQCRHSKRRSDRHFATGRRSTGSVTQLVHSGIADIGISGVDATLPSIERIKVGGVDSFPSRRQATHGDRSRACTGRCAGLYCARAHRSLDADRRSRFFGDRCQDVATREPGLQRVAAGWYRLGNMRADGPQTFQRGAETLDLRWSGGFYAFHAVIAGTPPGLRLAG